jgi:hypothetical protein
MSQRRMSRLLAAIDQLDSNETEQVLTRVQAWRRRKRFDRVPDGVTFESIFEDRQRAPKQRLDALIHRLHDVSCRQFELTKAVVERAVVRELKRLWRVFEADLVAGNQVPGKWPTGLGCQTGRRGSLSQSKAARSGRGERRHPSKSTHTYAKYPQGIIRGMPEHLEFSTACATLLREACEGIEPEKSGTWFVQGKEGLFDALDSIDAAQASRQACPGCSSIAAHANHVLYMLRGAATSLGGQAPEGTWESTWNVQSVNEREWDEMRNAIREQVRELLPWYESGAPWRNNSEFATGALALLPHIAYHLGAIRQLLGFVKA